MKKPPTRSRPVPPANRKVVALVYDQLCNFEFGIAVEMFGLPRPEFENWYEFGLCAVDRGPMRSLGGLRMRLEGGLEQLRDAGTIVVPGWRGKDAPVPRALVAALRAAHARGARLVSFCSGVFVLAATGLLDGRSATTHWLYSQVLRERHPGINVKPDVLYVDEGSLLTSAGSAAAIDLCLHLIRRDFGPRMANQVARRVVLPTHRDGGQAQFIQAPVPPDGQGLGSLMEWVRRNLDRPLTLARLAGQARMSERSLIRRFEQSVGCSPKQWIIRERLARARELLEGSDISVERIAERCGLGSADTFRHHFRRQMQLSPAKYRERFALLKS